MYMYILQNTTFFDKLNKLKQRLGYSLDLKKDIIFT